MNPDIETFRELFLHDLEVQKKLKSIQDNKHFLEEAIKIGQENGLNFTVEQLKEAATLYASTGEGASPPLPYGCGPSRDHKIPLDTPTADGLIDEVRKTPIGECRW